MSRADDHKTVKILVVEDSPTQLEQLKFLLEEEGLSVVPAKNGREALAAARAVAVDMVISDVVMPEMDGYELCKALRADETLRHLPVILLTSLADPRDVIKGLESGANNFICKPYDQRALLARVQNVLANQEIRKATPSEMGINIFFAGQRFFITADRLQILDLLLSTYENAVNHNSELIATRDELRKLNEQLEARVTERTAALTQEIAERKRAEVLLRESEQRFRTAFEQAVVGIAHLTLDGRWLRVNQRLCSILGYSEEELLRRTFVSLTHPDDAADDRLATAALVSGEIQEYQREKRYVRKDGTMLWAFVAVVVVRDDHGAPAYFLAITEDINERKQMEASLRESELRHRVLLQNLPTGILVRGPDTRTTFANAKACELLGLAPEKLQDTVIGSQPWSFVREDKTPLPLEDYPVNAALRTGQPTQPVLLGVDRTASSDRVWVLATAFPEIGDDGRVTNVIITLHDATSRVQAEEMRAKLEEQLRASQRMEAIGSLAGGVAHDFNNLLSLILNYTAFAIDEAPPDSTFQQDLLEVKKAGERAVALTRQLLAFSRKQILQPEPLDLNQIAAGVEKMLRRILGEDIDFVQVLAPDLGLTMADPGQIEQVLMNLVVNARDAMPQGGMLTIETVNVEVDEEQAARQYSMNPGPYVRLTVSDTGHGMDAETRARIFEPFFTTKDKDKGTGLGLSTVYGIVKQSGGNISVYSEPGQGTTFKILLPRCLSVAKAPQVRSPTVPPRPTGTEVILVAEDEESLRKVAARTLGAAGYTVLTAANGDEAIAASAQYAGEIHLLLTDVVMPRMSGRALAEQLLETRPRLKVLYTSGYTGNAIVHHGVLDAGTHFLGKPVTSAELTRKVREVLDGGITNAVDGNAGASKPVAESRAQPLDNQALQALPRDLLARLRKAVTAARYDEVVEVIETIRMMQPDVATELRRMAALFDYDGLRDLLSEGQERDHGR